MLAMVIAGKYQHMTHDVLHWLPVCHPIVLNLVVAAFDCVLATGVAYFKDLSMLVADIAGRAERRVYMLA